MASKKYAYYNKGNKVAIVEQADTTSSGKLAVAHCTVGGHDNKADCEAAGGQWIPGSYGSVDNYGKYLSPVETISNGLEIEYTYAPTYTIDAVQQANKNYVNGWYVDENGYVNLILTNVDIAASTTLAADLYINITESQIWNGVHKIKSVGTDTWHGYIQLNTKYEASPYIAATSFDFDVDETVSFAQAEDFIKEDDYMVIVGAESVSDNNTGLFKVGTIVGDNDITLSKKYTISDTSSSQYTADDFEVEAAASLTNVSKDCKAYKAYRDPMGVSLTTVMEDESFDLDLNDNQSLAVVYYLKARMAEDGGDFKTREYFLREFKKQVEKFASGRKYGPHIAQGFWGMRR